MVWYDGHINAPRAGSAAEPTEQRFSVKKCLRDACEVLTDNPKFCSASCATKVNNVLFPKRKRIVKECDYDGCATVVDKRVLMCPTHRKVKKIDQWLSGEWDGGGVYLSTTVRDYLISEADFSCSSCGFNTPHPSGGTILQVDHINGDGTDHRKDNLRVVCPNCHALTPTYGGRNIGNGRAYRRERYKKKS